MSNLSPLNAYHQGTGAVFQDQEGWAVPVHFGNPLGEYEAAVQGGARIDLCHQTRIEATGLDAASFLHNLSSNDTRNMPDKAGCEAFFCTSKARGVAHVRISRFPATETPTFRLEAVAGQGERLLAHLNRYLISEQVELADITSEWGQVLIAGPAAQGALESLFGTSLAELQPWHLAQPTPPNAAPIFLRRRDDLSIPAFDLWCPRANVEDTWNRLGMANLPSAGSAVLDILRLEAGSPVWGRDIDEQRFVAEVNRAAQAISFSKGCYMGQEPIVMARDRGQLNRLLLGLIVPDEEEPLVPGSKVFQGETEVGQVTSSAFSPRLGKVIALAYLRRGSWEAGTTVTAFPPSQGRACVVSALPFVSL